MWFVPRVQLACGSLYNEPRHLGETALVELRTAPGRSLIQQFGLMGCPASLTRGGRCRLLFVRWRTLIITIQETPIRNGERNLLHRPDFSNSIFYGYEPNLLHMRYSTIQRRLVGAPEPGKKRSLHRSVSKHDLSWAYSLLLFTIIGFYSTDEPAQKRPKANPREQWSFLGCFCRVAGSPHLRRHITISLSLSLRQRKAHQVRGHMFLSFFNHNSPFFFFL